MAEDESQKTEKPTPQRLKKARKEGQIPRTQELGTWLARAVGQRPAADDGRPAARHVRDAVDRGVPEVIARPEAGSAVEAARAGRGAVPPVPRRRCCWPRRGRLAGGAAQGGVTLATKAMKPTLKKLNPFPGIKRMFGTQGSGRRQDADQDAVARHGAWIVLQRRGRAGSSAGGSLLAVGRSAPASRPRSCSCASSPSPGWPSPSLDYVVVRRRIEKKLKMSKYEIKQEHKQSEGDPHMKAHRRARQLAMSPQPDDGRRRHRRRPAGQPHPRRRRAEVRPGARRAAGGRQGRRRGRRPDPRARPRSTGCRWSQDIPLARALHASCDLGQEIPPSCSRRSPGCWRSSCTCAPRACAAASAPPGRSAPDAEGCPSGRAARGRGRRGRAPILRSAAARPMGRVARTARATGATDGRPAHREVAVEHASRHRASSPSPSASSPSS